jgi:ribonuclease HI
MILRVAQFNTAKSCTQRSRTNQLLSLLNEYDIDIALLQETQNLNSSSSPPGWTLLSSSCCSILCRSSITIGPFADLTVDCPEYSSVGAQIVIPDSNTRVVFASVYRHIRAEVGVHDPSVFLEWIHQRTLHLSDVELVIGGDFNFHSTRFGSATDDPQAYMLTDIEASHQPHGRFLNTGDPTYIGWPLSVDPPVPSAIDLTFALSPNHNLEFSNWRTTETDRSDHCLITFDIAASAPVDPATPSARFKTCKSAQTPSSLAKLKVEVTKHIVQSQLASAPLDSPEDIDSTASTLTDILQGCALKLKLIALKSTSRRSRRTIVGWDEDCMEAVKLLRQARSALKKASLATPPRPQEVDLARQRWRNASEHLDEVAVIASRKSWRNYCTTVDPDATVSQVWKQYRSVMGRCDGSTPSSCTLPLLHPNGTILHPSAQAAQLAQYWSTVSALPDVVPNLPTPASTHPQHDDPYNQPFSPEELQCAYQESNPRSAPGADGISYSLIENAGSTFDKIFLKLMNRSLALGHFPECWKHCIVTPLQKCVSAVSNSDYRPIALLSCLGKTFERMVSNRLHHFLESGSFFSKSQTGFRRHLGTNEALLKVIQTIFDAWNDDKDLCFVALDIKKAFDTVWHDGLLFKVEHHAHIRGPMLNWIRSYLSNRTGQVRVGDFLSSLVHWARGVPQGSVLGPLLFLIFINDLVSALPSDIQALLYADDSALFTDIPSTPGPERDAAILRMQQALDTVTQWMLQWLLQLSEPKTQLMVFLKQRVGRNRLPTLPTPHLFLSGQLIQPSTDYLVYLGIALDSSLSFKHHVKRIVASVHSRIQLLRAITSSDWGCDRASLRLLYLNWIRPKLEYGSPIFASMSKSVSVQLDRIQNAAARIILRASATASTVAMSVQAELEPLGIRRVAACATALLKLRHITTHSGIGEMWHNWILKNPNPRVPFPTDPTGKFHLSTRKPSPFEIMHSIAHEFRILKLIERPVQPATSPAPWSLHSKQLNPVPSWPHIGSASTRDSKQYSLARDYAEAITRDSMDRTFSNDRGLLFFTDGSAFHDAVGGSGCSAVCLSSPIALPETHDRPGNRCATSFDAEVLGIRLALELAVKALPQSNLTHVTILSDCQEALRCAINSHAAFDAPPSVLNSISNLKSQLSAASVQLQLDWIPAHTGSRFNSLADDAAKKAATISRNSEAPLATDDLLHSSARRYMKANIRQRHHLWWELHTKGRWLYNLQPTLSYGSLSISLSKLKLPRRILACIDKLRIGNASTNQILTTVGKAPTSFCSNCPTVPDTVSHRLLDCPHYISARQLLTTALRRMHSQFQLSIQSLLGSTGYTSREQRYVWKHLAVFLETTQLHNLFLFKPS